MNCRPPLTRSLTLVQLVRVAASMLALAALAAIAGCGSEGGSKDLVPKRSIEPPASLVGLTPDLVTVAEADLPSGWKQDGPGKWLDAKNANQVVVYIQENPAKLKSIISDTTKGVKAGGGKILEGPEPTLLFGDDRAQRLTYTRSMEGVDVQAIEYYLVEDGVVAIATGVIFPTGKDEIDEIRKVLNSLRIKP